MAEFLATTPKRVLVGDDVREYTGLRFNVLTQVLRQSADATRAFEARGWAKTTRKAVGLAGKGWALVRD